MRLNLKVYKHTRAHACLYTCIYVYICMEAHMNCHYFRNMHIIVSADPPTPRKPQLIAFEPSTLAINSHVLNLAFCVWKYT